MKELLKRMLKAARIYHPIQMRYRESLWAMQRLVLRNKYRNKKGKGFTCNFCNESYESFAPWRPSKENDDALSRHEVIAGYGENIICPNCLSTARERLVLARLMKMDLNGKRVLHISPEKKIFDYLNGIASVTAIDIQPGFYRNIESKMRKADITALPYDALSFDLVIANHVLEHVPDDRRAMGEIFRVLKKGGVAVLQVPFSKKLATTIEDPGIDDAREQSKLFGQKDHVRIYGLEDFVERLRGVGFEVRVLEDFEDSFAFQRGEVFFEILKPLERSIHHIGS